MSAARARVFFALWPDANTRRLLGQAARQMHRALHGRRTADASIHLTLAFVGEVGVQRLPDLAAPPLGAMRAFELSLDRCGCWPRNGVGWIAPSSVPAQLEMLVAGMHAWLRAAGFVLEERPWQPHVTLVRKAECVPLTEPVTPIFWRAEEFVLVRSAPASDRARYRVLGRWPLLP